MAIRTLPSQERCSNKNVRGGEGGTEPRRKLKKLRSVKVANLDRLRLSMRREKTRFDPESPSESSSSPVSGTSSPNYMKATTSWVARKASSSSSTTPERRISPASRGKSNSKLSNVSVEQCSDPSGVHIPVEIKPGKNLKRVPTMNRPKKLSSMKSMKIRARYSQFPDVGMNELEGSSGIVEFGDNASAFEDQDSMVRVTPKQKGVLERSLSRSRSIRLTRLKSVRSSRRPKSRFGGGVTMRTNSETQNSSAEPQYLNATSSQEARKHPVTGLTRTSSLRPLRILAKIPSLRTRRSKVRKRPETAPLPRISVDRATCSLVLKSSKFSEHIQLNSGGLESEGTLSLHVCPYNYCSLHSHHHHGPSPPLKEFIYAKRQSAKNQKGKQLEKQSMEAAIRSRSVTETNQVEQVVEAESPAVKEVINASTADYLEAKDSGMDFLIKVFAKPRKKWAIEGSSGEDVAQSNGSDHTLFRYYEWKLEDRLGDTTRSKARDEALNEDKLGFSTCDIELGDNTQQQTTKFAVPDSSVNLPELNPKSSSIESESAQGSLKNPSQNSSTDSETSSGGDLITILSNEQKYSSIWHLIYQQFVSSEEPMAGNQGIKSLSEDGDNENAVMEKVDFDQTAAIKLVQDALTAILQRDGQSPDQQAIPDQEMPHSPGEQTVIPAVMSEENVRERGEVAIERPSLESGYKMHKVEQEVEALQQKPETDEGTRPVRNKSKSLSKLRKLIATAKFVKAMEKLRKIRPGRPQYLSSELTSEEERVYLRHLSMNGKKNVEEWMLDFALRKVISRLGLDEQRRVALLVEAFETLTPDNRERSIKCYPVKGKTVSGIELATPKNEATKQSLESKQEISISDELIRRERDDEVSLYPKGNPEERSLREGHRPETCTTGDKILRGPDETGILSEPSGNCTTSNDRAFEEPVTGNEVSRRALEATFRLPVGDNEVNPASDMSTVLFDKNRYTSMWNMIYQHVISSEASLEGNNLGSDAYTCQEMNDQDSTQSSYSTDREEDEDNQSASHEKRELNQSAAIKLVKEAVNAILQRYELSSEQQSIADQNNSADDVGGLCIATPAYSTEESCRRGDNRVTTHSEPEVLEKKGDTSLQQVEDHGPKELHKKMSKSLSKLKRAIVTAKFIKAMERLRKINQQKTWHLLPEPATEEERVYLRHLSMDGRKNSEEWMLDYALRQVISKLAPDLQKRVALLVEAFETVNPEQKENGGKYYPLKEGPATRIRLANPTNKELKQLVYSEQERSIFDVKVPQKQDNGFSLSHEFIPAHRGLQQDDDHQVSRADDKTQQNTDKSTVSNSDFQRSKTDSMSAYADVNVEELSTRDAETKTTSKVTSVSPRGDPKGGIAVDMTTILSDKQKYTSMWHLIYQHAVPSQASTALKQRYNEADEDEQDEDANNGEEMNYLDSTESNQRTNQTENEDNQIQDGREQELESAAIKLVKEAINTILQYHEMRSDEQSLQEHDITVDGGGDLCNKAAAASTEENSVRWKTVGKHRHAEMENKPHTVVNENVPVQKKVEANKVKTSQRSSSRSFSKLRNLFITAKVMKAMKRMRRISLREPRYLSPVAASEEERVNLRHQDINERRDAEEWMLDYALRKVISNLPPEQQRRVALLVEAFETISPDQKGIRSYMKAEAGPDIDVGSTADGKQTIESGDTRCTSYDDHIQPNTGDIGKAPQQKRSPGEEHPPNISNFKTKLHKQVFDSDGNNLYSHHHSSLKGCPVGDTSNTLTERKEIDPNTKSEPPQAVSLSIDSKQDHKADVTKGMSPGKQNYTSMWHLIYQHAKSVTAAEAERSLSEKVANNDDLNKGNASSEMTVDADADDSDASSVTSELTESDAVKLVREAISDILSVPQELDSALLSSNLAAASDENQTAGEAEKSEKTLCRGYSKLRKVIICNKFIKAMEKAKMRKSHPQKCRNQTLMADEEAEKVTLKPSAVSEKKSADELLLDHALQKVIAGLAPVQRRRVALLVEAFEKVNPATEEAGKRFSSNAAAYLSSVGNAKKRKEPIFGSSQSPSELCDGLNFKLHGLLTTSSKEVATDSALAEVHKEKSLTLSKEDWRDDSPSGIMAATSDVKGTQSNDCKDPAQFNSRDTCYLPVQHEEATLLDVNYSRPAAETAENPSEPEDLKEEGKPRMENDMASNNVRHTSLWRLLVQHVNTDIFDETETQITGESDANAKELQELDKNDEYQLSSEVNHDDDTNVQMRKSISFELQEKEAINVVQEALDAILTCDDQSTTTCDTSDQDNCTENQGQRGEPSSVTKEIEGVKHLVDSVTKPKEEQISEEKLSNSYSKLSQVILCKRFIKAMDKMRKLNPKSPQDHSEKLQSEEKLVHRMRQTAFNQRKNWEEWMLDHAMQQVVGNLAPAQKKKVSLLVQAFEKVSSQPEPGTGQKGTATGS